MDLKNLKYNRPFYEDQVMPKGELTLDMKCHACWHYAMLAQKNHELVGRGPEDQVITYDAENNEKQLWRNKNYKNLAIHTTIVYGYESPEDWLVFVDRVVAEGRRLGINFAMEIFMPWKSDT